MEQYRLTIQTAGPPASLAEAMLEIGEAVSVSEIDMYWDTGIGAQAQRLAKVEITLGAEWVPMALARLEQWLSEADVHEAIVEIEPTFSRVIRRDD